MAAADQARGYILFCGTQPAAFQLCYVQGTTMVVSQTGYDPAYAEFSPGTTQLYLLLEKLFAEGEMEFLDLMEGTMWLYRSNFATLRVPSMRFLYFRTRPDTLCFVLFTYLLKKLEKPAVRAKRAVQRVLNGSRSPFSPAPIPSDSAQHTIANPKTIRIDRGRGRRLSRRCDSLLNSDGRASNVDKLKGVNNIPEAAMAHHFKG